MSSNFESVTARVVEAYGLIFDRAKAEATRPSVLKYLKAAHAEGVVDEERLAVGCMKHLRERDQPKAATRRLRTIDPATA